MRLFLLPVVAVLAAAAGPPSCGPGEQCVPLPRCPSVLQSMRLDQRYRPRHCGFQDSTTRVPDVCCPGGGAPQEDACPEPAPPLAPTPDMTCEKFVNSLTDEEDSRPGNLARRCAESTRRTSAHFLKSNLAWHVRQAPSRPTSWNSHTWPCWATETETTSSTPVVAP
ncbi:hypothetical protein FOCC_FOCC017695, partial [Frankliniella occidentalis]